MSVRSVVRRAMAMAMLRWEVTGERVTAVCEWCSRGVKDVKRQSLG